MDEAVEWSLLAAQFAELRQLHNGKLFASCPPPGWGIGDLTWQIGGADDDRFASLFEAVAERAGVLLGSPIGPAALFRWLNELKGESPHYQRLRQSRDLPDGTMESREGGIISDVCTASQDHCYRLETAALDRQLHDSPASAPSTSIRTTSRFVDRIHRQLEREEEVQHELRLREIREGRALAPQSQKEAVPKVTGKLPEEASAETLASQIDRLREECRITVEELAEELGVDPRSVFRHLSGESMPRSRHLAAYERVFSARLQTKVVIRKTSG